MRSAATFSHGPAPTRSRPATTSRSSLQPTDHARALAADVRRRANQLPKDGGHKALADLVLKEAEGRLPTTLEGAMNCVQNRARLVRTPYERLDRSEAASATRAA